MMARFKGQVKNSSQVIASSDHAETRKYKEFRNPNWWKKRLLPELWKAFLVCANVVCGCRSSSIHLTQLGC